MCVQETSLIDQEIEIEPSRSSRISGISGHIFSFFLFLKLIFLNLLTLSYLFLYVYFLYIFFI